MTSPPENLEQRQDVYGRANHNSFVILHFLIAEEPAKLLAMKNVEGARGTRDNGQNIS